MTAGADLRLLRAAVFTAACVALSAAGHTLASGAAVPLWALAAGSALVLAAAVPLAGRERRLTGIGAALVTGQAALHLLFSAGHARHTVPEGRGVREVAADLLCGGRTGAALTEAQAHGIVAAAGLRVPGPHGAGSAGTEAAGPADALHTALATLSVPMLLGHLLAAAASGWLLRRGEAALWRLVRLSAATARSVSDALPVRAARRTWRLLRALARRAGLPRRPVRVPPGHRPAVPPREPWLTGAVTRRGPPRPDAFALAA
jgi:hypothetical protein